MLGKENSVLSREGAEMEKMWFGGEGVTWWKFSRLLQKMVCSFKFDWSWKVIQSSPRVETDDWWPAVICRESVVIRLVSTAAWTYSGLWFPTMPGVSWIRYEQPWEAIGGCIQENDVGEIGRGRRLKETAAFRVTCRARRESFIKAGSSNRPNEEETKAST